MKENPAEKEILDRMRPGVLSAEGFLGADPRSLDQMIAEDVAELEGEGITIGELGAALNDLHQRVDAALGGPVSLADGQVTAEEIEVMGRIPCPFGCGTLAHKAVIHVRFHGKQLLLTPLHGHLISEHGFFQGRGTIFRLEPKVAAELFRLLCPEP
ncbi:MAG: hypothetical protein RRC34_13545, partial [Lentisphaeria bacterium]|nr:hypothetical protein [Lentisphaeria bacterium]